MRVANEIYDFITGGSIAAPICVALAIVCAFLLPAYGMQAFIGFAVLALISATFEKPS